MTDRVLQKQVTTSEALFINKGEATKSSKVENIDDLLDGQELKEENFLSMDFKFDSLTSFLSNFSKVINQHGVLLNMIKADVEQKSYKNEVSDAFKQSAQCFAITDQKFMSMLDLRGLLPENRGEDLVIDSMNQMSNKMTTNSVALNLLFKKNMELEKRLNDQDKEILDLKDKKADNLTVTEKILKLTSDVHVEIENNSKKIYEKLELQRKDFREEYDDLSKRIMGCENKTIGEIKKCKILLEEKADKEWVENLSDSTRVYFEDSIKNVDKNNLAKLVEWKQCMEDAHRGLRCETDNKLSEMLTLLRIIEMTANKKINYEEAQEDKKIGNNRFEDLTMRIKEMHRKVDNIFDKSKGSNLAYECDIDKKIQSNNQGIDVRFSGVQKEVDKIRLYGVKTPGEGGQGGGGQDGTNVKSLDEARINEKIDLLQEEIDHFREELRRNGNICQNLQTDISNKIDLQTFSSSLGKKVDRDEVQEIINRFNLDDDRFGGLENFIKNLDKKVTDFTEVMDKRHMKLKKEVDINYIQKLLKGKAEDAEVRKQFQLNSDKQDQVGDTMDSLRKDFESLQNSFKKIATFIALQQEESQSNTLATTKNPLCLSCGRGGAKFTPEAQQLQGSDGQYYHADPANKHQQQSSDFFVAGKNKSQLLQDQAYDKASDLFDRNLMVQQHNSHAHLPVDHSLRKSGQGRVVQPKFRPASAQQKSAIGQFKNAQSNDMLKADIKQVRPSSGYKLTKTPN